ncbi:hypothetical protein CVV26_01940 [Candidatus Kuenenbacteria bacterium HGW-Kuenenbacteria-1]|uniref:Colicin V production protein n=1 Tax=Candidatus Kuenenbacteria bacterium HGW-Kuenenbacteria-1 TaxID=2013812 RepID=A0A2N1UNJ2_9BACT|nr:MAG: hypothetical protein CVV26_01940 [Candidatus Kuenenbacteria bacterium HGW-Kuenenbacteria-1]
MSLIDVIIIIVLLLFLIAGFRLGFIRSIGALIGFIVGIFVATFYYDVLANLFLPLFLGNLKIAQIISFIFILVLASSLVGFIFHIIDRVFKIVAIVPFLKTFNNFIGGIFSLIEGVLILGIILYLFGSYFQQFLINSTIAPILIKMAGILIPFLPEGLKCINCFLT